MKKNRLFFSSFIVLLLVVIIHAGHGLLSLDNPENEIPVTVLLNDSNNDCWKILKKGLNQGAQEFRMKLNIVSTGKITSIEEEKQILKREINSGTQGIIIDALESGNKTFYLEESEEYLPVVLVQSDVKPERTWMSVTADQEGIGKALAEEILCMETEEKELKIGVLAGNQNQLSMEKRLDSFREALQKTSDRAYISWVLFGAPTVGRIRLYQEKNPADILVALGEEETEVCVDYVLAYNDDECRLYGEGCTEKLVYYLDKGVIKTLIASDKFMMGYQSAKMLAEQIRGNRKADSHISVEYWKVNKDNLYDERTQRILFPTVQ